MLDAKETKSERDLISLHWSVSERALVELPLAATEVRRREKSMGRLMKCILASVIGNSRLIC